MITKLENLAQNDPLWAQLGGQSNPSTGSKRTEMESTTDPIKYLMNGGGGAIGGYFLPRLLGGKNGNILQILPA